VQLRSEYNYDIALTKKAGDQANLALIETITTWAAQVDTIFAEADDAEATRKAEFLENYQTIATNSKELAAIAQSLATLAKEESFEDRAQFLAGFAKQLKDDFDTQVKQGNESAKHAEALLDSISN
jgi:ribosomal protein L17